MENWKQTIIATQRGNFEVFQKGEGPPLCVTHHYSVFNETGDYYAEAFTKNHAVYLVNLREAGQSEKSAEPYQLSMLETIFDLEAIREELGIEKWGFAGHSTGGMLGILYGIYCSESLSYLILTGAAAREYATFSKECIYNSEHPEFEEVQNLIEQLKQGDIPDGKRRQLGEERTKLSLFRPEKYTEYFHRKISKSMSAARMDFFNRELPIYDVTRKLHLIKVPALILCGRHDVQCPLTYSIEMKEHIPDARLVVFEESNHYPFLEEAELFDKELMKFLSMMRSTVI
ncbi:alpha/beta fold hydrolase [Planococcus liqunii]|uniref:alpha/beta fold hydrolase n=1 Tax=Planococcus liqunii TaxID=3058394 RepID=UPI00261A4F73|nr:alpha/beta fold hydrolase [Planococcus sp. N056]WKA52320.1 alpha/beta fold hydrolase [Planococcus sp. N056]